MVTGDTKKIVVIKNISSNLIEEAILILKSDPGKQNGNESSGLVHNREKLKNEFLFKEAEMIINNYVRENKLLLEENKRGKAGIFARKPFVNILINMLLLSSIAFLLFLAVKLI